MSEHITASGWEPEQTVLGLELGSTRIKAVLLDRQHRPLAGGSWARR